MTKKPMNKRAFAVLFLIVATELIGFGLLIPFLPQIAHRFESSKLLLGILMASYSFAQFFASPILGSLSDKFGRRPVLIISKLGTALSYLLLAFADSYWLILVSRLIDGFTGGNFSVAKAYAIDITSEEDRPKGMAIIGASFGVGFVLGPALGLLLYKAGNTHAPAALAAAGLSFLALLFTILLLKEPENRQKAGSAFSHLASIGSIFSVRNTALICCSYFVYMCIFSGFETTFSLYTEQYFGYGIKQNAYLFLSLGVMGILVQGMLSRKATQKLLWVISIGFCSMGSGYLLLSQAHSLSTLIPGLACLSLGFALSNTYLSSLLSLQVKENQVGAVMGVYESFGSLSRIFGPIVTYVAIFDSLKTGYLLFGIAMLLLVVGFRLIYKKQV